MVMEYQYNCVYPQDIDELNDIVDNMKEIKPATFFKRVNLQTINDSLMYVRYKSLRQVRNDYGNNFFSYKRNKQLIYILNNSAIEYIFK